MSILIIAEKPSVSRAVSSVIGAKTSKKGYIEGNGYIVSWCVGHLVSLKYPNDYDNGCHKPVKRLWVSSLEESAISSALSKMKPMSDYDNLFCNSD